MSRAIRRSLAIERLSLFSMNPQILWKKWRGFYKTLRELICTSHVAYIYIYILTPGIWKSEIFTCIIEICNSASCIHSTTQRRRFVVQNIFFFPFFFFLSSLSQLVRSFVFLRWKTVKPALQFNLNRLFALSSKQKRRTVYFDFCIHDDVYQDFNFV